MDTSCFGPIISSHGYLDDIITRETVAMCEVGIITFKIFSTLFIAHLREQRITGLIVGMLLAISVAMEPALKQLPIPVLYGVLLVIGVASFSNIQVGSPAPQIRTHYICIGKIVYLCKKLGVVPAPYVYAALLL